MPGFPRILHVLAFLALPLASACVQDEGPPPIELNEDPYGDCTDDYGRAVCKDDEPYCDAYPDASFAELNVCVPGCEVEEDCPVPSTGDATVKCVGDPTGCVLDCSNGEQCPDDMECAVTGACMWAQ